MAFDKEKDALIRELGVLEDDRGNQLVAELRAYNGGRKKIALVRKGVLSNGNEFFKPVGRMSMEEAAWLNGVLTTLCSNPD